MIGIITKNIDFLLEQNIHQGDTCVFFDGYIPPMVADNTAKFSVSSIHDFTGIGISTCIATTQKLIATSMLSKKIYLIADPSWVNLNNFRYVDLLDIFWNDEIKIVALNKEIYNILARMFREPDALMEEFDAELLENI